MKTILINEGCPNPVALGEKGENGVSAVLFDYSEWISDFGEGAISLLVKRKGDTAAYPVVLSTADGIATWTISDIDTAVQGYGKAEYVFTIDDKVAKSAVFSFFVAHDLGPSGDPPDPYESWIDTLTALGGETLINAQAAQTAQEAAETAQTAAETAATNAESSATAAAQSAGAARFAAESALASSDSASAAATTATASASAASASATQAAASASAAEASETAAYDSANTAAEEAEVAQTAATTATTAATNASASASSASASATAASGSASSASASATTATTAATSATTSANNAAQSASAASGSATQAAQSATNAAASATSAASSASAAATSESNAAQSATSAAASATDAATEAAKLNNYLPVDSASGSIASFSDGADNVPVKALTVSLEPVQDLHGQASPYPAGGGKNKFSPTPYKGLLYGIAVGTSISLTDGDPVTVNGNSITYDVASWGYRNFKTAPLSAGTYNVYIDISAITNARFSVYVVGSDDVIKEMNNYAQAINVSKTLVDGDYFVVYAGSNTAQTLTFTNWQIESGSSYTAWSPYSNICPITGHTQTEIWRAGKNLIRFPYADNRTEILGVSVTYHDDGTLTFNGTPSGGTMFFNLTTVSVNPIMLKAGTYTLSNGGVGGGLCRITAVRNGQYFITTDSSDGDITFAIAEDAVFNFYISTQNGTAMNNILVKPQLELGSIATDFEPYTAQTITIPLGQTVYGGSIDVVGGKVVVDRAMKSVSEVSNWKNFTPLNDGSGYYIYSANFFPVYDNKTICNAYKKASIGAWEDMTFGECIMTKNAVLTVPPEVNTLALATAYINNLGVCFVYTLAEPIEIQLTAEQLSTLYGQNNVWSDAGDTSVTYRADIQKYIEKMISEALA